MEIVTDSIQVSTRGDCEIVDLTEKIAACVKKHRFVEGQVLAFVSGSTAGLTTVEHEPGLLKDLPELFERLAPRGARYHHEETWHDGNGHAHVRASLLGPSIAIPFREGELCLGTWQQVILIDFDNRPRRRDVVLQIAGKR